MKSVYIVIALWCQTLIAISSPVSEKRAVAILPFSSEDAGLSASGKLKEYYTFVSSAFLRDGRFTVVERNSWELIHQERELQKSEEFIDGTVIEQGKSIGAEYLVTGFFYVKQNAYSVKLSLIDVATGELTGSQIIDFSSAQFQEASGSTASVASMVMVNKIRKDFIYKYFPQPKFIVLRKLGNAEKSKLLLVAAGAKDGIQRKDIMEIVVLQEEIMEGKTVERHVQVGKGKVTKIENENFCIVTVTYGLKEINKNLVDSIRLYSKISL